MKTRNGFVSNSSSSSFVIMGFKLNDNIINKEKFIKKFNPKAWVSREDPFTDIDDIFHDTLYDCDFGIPGAKCLSDDGPGFIGIVLADISSEDSFLDAKTIEVSDCLGRCEQLRKLLEIEDEPRIYTGTRSC